MCKDNLEMIETCNYYDVLKGEETDEEEKIMRLKIIVHTQDMNMTTTMMMNDTI